MTAAELRRGVTMRSINAVLSTLSSAARPPNLPAAIAVILGTAAMQANTGAQAADTRASGQIGEITVTAQRRSENIQDVPIAVQAFTSDAMQEMNV